MESIRETLTWIEVSTQSVAEIGRFIAKGMDRMRASRRRLALPVAGHPELIAAPIVPA